LLRVNKTKAPGNVNVIRDHKTRVSSGVSLIACYFIVNKLLWAMLPPQYMTNLSMVSSQHIENANNYYYQRCHTKFNLKMSLTMFKVAWKINLRFTYYIINSYSVFSSLLFIVYSILYTVYLNLIHFYWKCTNN